MANITIPTTGTVITTAWGTSVAVELNTRCLKIDGTNGAGAVMQMTGDLLLRNVNPSNDNHAARKKYVDDSVANRVPLAGGTMTGELHINETDSDRCLVLRSQANVSGSFRNIPYLAFYNNTATTRFGIVQGTANGIVISADVGDVSLTGDDINLNAPATVTGDVRSNHQTPGGNWDAANFQAYDSRTSGGAARMSWNAGGSGAQIRAISGQTRLELVNHLSTAFAPMHASDFVETSSAASKIDITDPPPGSLLATMRSVPLVQFRRPGGDGPGDVHNDKPKLGMMADAVAAAFPGVASYDIDGQPDGWNIAQMVSVVYAAVLELADKVEAL